jgi:hypothetical protein
MMRKSIANRKYIPYTPDDALRIRQTGQLDYIPTFSKPPNLSGFSLEDLRGRPILSWPPELPDFDPRGHPSAPKFQHWKKAQDSKIGIAGNYFSFKGGGLVPCHSALERCHLSHFEMNPFVVEIRCQYPEWERSIYRLYESMGLNIPKNKLMTIDFVLTLKIPGRTGFHYHAVSTKPYEKLMLPAVLRRHAREFNLLRRWGCTHEIMTEHSITRREGINCRRLLEYMRYVEDIGSYQSAALNMANAFFSRTVRGTCDWEIGAVSSHFGWNLNEGYRIFAIANFLGYLALNHDYKILPDHPLVLAGSQVG